MPSTVQIFHAAPGLDVRSQGPSLTAAVLISDPLIVNPFAVRFTIESFDHGHTSPSGRRWSWFEASVVRKVDDAQESALKMPMEQLATPSDFDPLLRTQGWHIVPIEKAIDFEGFPVLTERPSTFLAHNPLKPVASTHVRTWNQSHPDRSIRNWNALLSVLQRGDRIAVWARAKSRDFVNHTISVQAELFSVPSLNSILNAFSHCDGNTQAMIHGMQVDDTLDFAECFHDSSEPMNLGTSIYACILVCAKLPSHTNIQRAVDYGTLWINATPTADPTHSERQNIVNELIDQQREWLRFEEDGVFSEVPWAMCEPRYEWFPMGVDNWLRRHRLAYIQNRRLDDLDRAIGLGTLELQRTEKSTEQVLILGELGYMWAMRWLRSEDDQHLENAIQSLTMVEGILDREDPKNEQRAEYLSALSGNMSSRYSKHKDIRDLNQAIDYATEAIHRTTNTRDRARFTIPLIFAYTQRYDALSEPDDSVRTADLAMECSNVFDPTATKDVAHAHTVAVLLLESYERRHDLTLLNRVIEITRLGSESTSLGADWRSLCSITYGKALGFAYDHSGHSEDLEIGIQVLKRPISSSKVVGDQRWAAKEYLARLLQKRAHTRNSKTDLEEAQGVVDTVLEDACLDDSTRTLFTLLRYRLLLSSYRWGQHPEIAKEVIEGAERILSTHDLDRRLQTRASLCLGEALFERIQQSPEYGDSARLNQLAKTLTAEFTVGDRISDEAAHIPEWYTAMFLHQGDHTKIDDAINLAQSILNSVDPSSPEFSRQQEYLAASYWRRFDYSNSREDLYRSIDLLEALVKATPPQHRSYADRSLFLAEALATRYMRELDTKDLDKAMAVLIESSPLANIQAARGRILHYLASTISDVDSAIMQCQRAIDTLLADETSTAYQRARFQNQIGQAHLKRFELSGRTDKAAIDAAVAAGKAALAEVPEAHYERSASLGSIGNLVLVRWEMMHNEADLSDGLQYWVDAFLSPASQPLVKVKLGMRLAPIVFEARRWKEARYYYNEVLGLLPLLSLRAVDKPDQLHILQEAAGIGPDAAAVMMQLGLTDEAWQVMETGRGVIANELLNLRSDLSELRDKRPDLAQRYDQLCRSIDAPRRRLARNIHVNDNDLTSVQVEDVRRAQMELDELTKEIRLLPDFSTFRALPSLETLKELAREGPIIVVNLSQYRSDAFLFDRTGYRHLHLPKLVLADCREKARALKDPSAMTAVLEWLWDVMAEPILSELGISEASTDSDLPHIWWIPTGLLCHFPLHAAGYHLDHSGRTVLDRAMSSYSSSLKTLVAERSSAPTRAKVRETGYAVLVAMPKTPGSSNLPNAERELQEVDQLCPSLGLQSVKPPARRADVLASLKNARLFHFAGHGKSDAVDPSRSSLLLESKDDPLTVEDFYERNFRQQRPFLAYLSACSTGSNSIDNLIDESAHLISALQLAGFRHVIGTLWEVVDRLCVDVAKALYETLRDEEMTDEAVCRGLHKATRALRDSQREMAQSQLRRNVQEEEMKEEGGEEPRDEELNAKIESEDEEDDETEGSKLADLLYHLRLEDFGRNSAFFDPKIGPATRQSKTARGAKNRRRLNPSAPSKPSIKAELWAPYVHYGV